MTDIEEQLDQYWRKSGNRSWSGIPLKQVYGPGDIQSRIYTRDVNEPGEYPYVRGIYPDMYRGRMWTDRQITGHSSPEETNRRLKFLLESGQNALMIIMDGPLMCGSDHPLAEGAVGRNGVPICSLHDMEKLMAGIPQDKVSVSLELLWVGLPLYLALAEERGIPETALRGTTCGTDVVTCTTCNIEGDLAIPARIRATVDTIEYAIRNLPKWNPFLGNGYVVREAGITAIQEVAFAFAGAFSIIDELLRRGLAIDEIAPKIVFNMSTHIDLFEEVAKYRAARRLWARTMKEKYGASDPRAMKFKFHTNSAGCMMVRQQMLNNVVRGTCASLAAILGGCQSLNTTPYDEPVQIPTEESHRLAIRTQQILAYETGVGNVTDPLGGSYYVESLTDRIEEEIKSLLEKIEEQGGGFEALTSGWIMREIENAALEYQRQVEQGERIVVGKNAFTIAEEADVEPPVHEVVPEAVEKHLSELRELKRTRDQRALRHAIDNLRRAAEDKSGSMAANLVPAMEAAFQANALVNEVWGTVREAYGYPYDSFKMVKSPFKRDTANTA